jgi:hypothetical protein
LKKIASPIGFYHPIDGVTNPENNVLHFLTTVIFHKQKKALAFDQDWFCHLAPCLWLILFYYWISNALVVFLVIPVKVNRGQGLIPTQNQFA